MIKVLLGNLDNIIFSLRNVVSKEIPIIMSYKLSKLIKQIEDEYKNYTTQRNKIIEKYGERDDKNKIIITDNKSIKIKPGTIENCTKDLEELNSIEFKIDFTPISIGLLGNIEVKPQDLFVLNQFFTD
jgi:hypothetical protein